MRRWTCTVATLLLSAAGCAVFLPRHPRSQDIQGERAQIIMLTKDAYASLATKLGLPPVKRTVSFTEPPGGRRPRVAFAAAAAPIVAGLVVDYVKGGLEAEAKEYESQFMARTAEDAFWVRRGDAIEQNYVGFRVMRTTAAFGEDKPAFDLVCVIEPSMDARAFRVRPVLFRLNAARVKVLGHRWWAPWTRLMSHEELESEVNVDIDALWVTDQNVAQSQTLASFAFKVTGYPLDAAPPLPDPAQPFGWFPGVPRSSTTNKSDQGTFTVTVRVTERDASRAKSYVEHAAKELANRRGDIVQFVQEKVGTTTTTRSSSTTTLRR